MHEVLSDAREKLKGAVDEAARGLLSVPPEQLEAYVFERGFAEGVSELHVVERAISAHLGLKTREAFATDKVLSSTKRLRALRAVELPLSEDVPNEQLNAFREAEIWEADELLNNAFTPIACGDVFRVDPGRRRDQDK